MSEQEDCILCRKKCEIVCKLCSRSISCISIFTHNVTCNICQEMMCGGAVPGKIIKWRNREGTIQTMCMNCIFDSALFHHANTFKERIESG